MARQQWYEKFTIQKQELLTNLLCPIREKPGNGFTSSLKANFIGISILANFYKDKKKNVFTIAINR